MEYVSQFQKGIYFFKCFIYLKVFSNDQMFPFRIGGGMRTSVIEELGLGISRSIPHSLASWLSGSIFKNNIF